MRRLLGLGLVVMLAALAAPASAQHDHMAVYSTEGGGGTLVLDWDFDKKVNAFQTFCAAGQCLFSTINPAVLSAEVDDPGGELFALDEGTRIRVEVVAADTPVTLNVGGVRLKKAGDAANLGTAPFHTHPSWQLVVTEGTEDEYTIAYRIKAPDSNYADSEVYVSTVSNAPQAVPTPCADVLCPGDCDDDGEATQSELTGAVQLALDGSTIESCRGMDANADGTITAEEVVAAVGVAADGCPERLPATLADIQATIFTPTCAIPTCHNAVSATGNLVLTPDESHAKLVDVPPDISAAADAGLLRVVAGDVDLSFLYRKLVGPRPEWGSRMPLNGACMPVEQLDQIRRWIVDGAQP